MIQITCKRISTTVNKEIHKNKHSHEMMRFQNRIIVFSSLHESVQICGSSHGPVFESPVNRVHNEHSSDPPVTEFRSHDRVRITVTRNQTYREEGESIHTQNTLTHAPIYTRHMCIHTWVIHIHTYYLHIHTLHTSWILKHIHAKDSRMHT